MASIVRWLVFVVALGGAASAAAQDRLFVGGGVAQTPYHEEIDAAGRFGASRGPVSPLVHQPLLAGGRYAVTATTNCGLIACAIVDWQGVTRPIPHAFVAIVATDPVRPRVFVQTAAGAIDAVDVETGVVTPLFAASPALSGPCGYAFSAARLFCVENGTAPSSNVVSTGGAPGETPQLVGTVAGSPNGVHPLLVTPDGQRLFAGEPGTGSSRLVLIRVATGARVTVDLPSLFELAWDDANERLLVMPAPRLGHAFTKDLVYLGSASFPYTLTAIAVSPATGRLYVRSLAAQSAGYGDAYTTAFDGRTYAPLSATVHTQGFGGPPRITVLSPPGAPRDAAAMVLGHVVTLTWTNVGAASAFLIEVGLAPGQTALTVPVSWQPQAAFAGVPAGTYYVRVRGVNAFGAGQPSAEVRVVVP